MGLEIRNHERIANLLFVIKENTVHRTTFAALKHKEVVCVYLVTMALTMYIYIVTIHVGINNFRTWAWKSEIMRGLLTCYLLLGKIQYIVLRLLLKHKEVACCQRSSSGA